MRIVYHKNRYLALFTVPVVAVVALVVVLLASSFVSQVLSQTSSHRQAVQNLVVTTASSDAISLSWDAHPVSVRQYRVTWTVEGQQFKHWSDSDWSAFPTTNQLTISGLEADTSYSVKVRARFDGRPKRSAWSSPLTVQTAPAAVIVAPQTLPAKAEPDSQVKDHQNPPALPWDGHSLQDIAKRCCSKINNPGDSVYYQLPGLRAQSLHMYNFYQTVRSSSDSDYVDNHQMQIYDASGHLIVQHGFDVAGSSTFNFMPDQAGTYYLRVYSATNDTGRFWIYHANRSVNHRGDRSGADCGGAFSTRCGIARPGSANLVEGNLKVGEEDYYKIQLQKNTEARICGSYDDRLYTGSFVISSPTSKWPWLFVSGPGANVGITHCTEYFTANFTGRYDVKVVNVQSSVPFNALTRTEPTPGPTPTEQYKIDAANAASGDHYSLYYELRN